MSFIQIFSFAVIAIVGVSSQEAGRARLHQKLIEGKTQDFVGPLSALGRGDPKCIDLATCFGLFRTVS